MKSRAWTCVIAVACAVMMDGCRTSPAPRPLDTVTAIIAGGWHTCELTSSHAAYCWGKDSTGELGDGTRHDQPVPAAVAGGRVFASIVAGYDYTCALTTSHAAYCWGDNAHGQLGAGDATASNVPAAVAGLPAVTAIQIAHAGRAPTIAGFHTCALSAGGVAYCWGDNSAGQLGDGSRIDRRAPVRAGGSLTFAELSLGAQHTCGRTAGRAIFCWGANDWGQLGDGTTNPSTTPVRVKETR